MIKGIKVVFVSSDKCLSSFMQLHFIQSFLHLCNCHQEANDKSILFARDTTIFDANLHSFS